MPQLSNFGGRFRPTESLWSITSKVCWSNRMPVTTMSRFFKGGFTGSLFAGFNVDDFSTVTGIERETLRAAMGLNLVEAQDYELRDLAYPSLRYCPTCMAESGFHSILFQFPLCSHCPIHPDEKLICGCQQCHAEIPHAIPSSMAKIYGCGHCGHRLWYPAQRPFVFRPEDSKLAELAGWAARWMKGVALYAGSASPLRHWVEHSSDDVWAKKGVPELDGVFTVRALRGAVEAGYWGGRLKVTDEAACSLPESNDVYLEVLNEVSTYAGLSPDGFGDWLHRWHSSPNRNPGRRQWAFAAWRAFWEAVQVSSELSGDGYSRKEDVVVAVFRANFRGVIVPSGFGPEVAEVNLLVFREVLRSTFAAVMTRVEAAAELPTFAELTETIRTAAAPVFLVKPAPAGAVVEWVHQKEVAQTGLAVFGAA